MRIVEFPISGNLAGGFRGDVNAYLDFLRTTNVELMMNYALQQWTADLALLTAPELRYGKIMTTCGLSGLHMPVFASYFRYLHFHLRHFDRLIFHSARYRDADYAKSHDLTNTTVIPNAVRAEEFTTPPAPGCRARHGIREDSFLVLTVANYTGGKGQDQLLEIIDRADIGRTTVVLVGKNFIDARSVDEVLAKPIARLSGRSGGGKTAICMQLPRSERSATSAQRIACWSPLHQRVAKRGSSWLDACQSGVAPSGISASVRATTSASSPATGWGGTCTRVRPFPTSTIPAPAACGSICAASCGPTITSTAIRRPISLLTISTNCSARRVPISRQSIRNWTHCPRLPRTRVSGETASTARRDKKRRGKKKGPYLSTARV